MKLNPDYVTAPRECLVWDSSGARILEDEDKLEALAARWTCAPITITDFRFVWWIRAWLAIKRACNWRMWFYRHNDLCRNNHSLCGWRLIRCYSPSTERDDPCEFKPRVIKIGDPLCG